MPRACSICSHKKRNEIDSLLVIDGSSLRDIAGQYGVTKSALQRHTENGHVIKKIAKAAEVKEVKEALTLKERRQKLVERIDTCLTKAEEANDLKAFASLMREAREMLKMDMQIEGELPDGGVTVQVLIQESNMLTEIFMEALRSEIDPETCRRVIGYIQRRKAAITTGSATC